MASLLPCNVIAVLAAGLAAHSIILTNSTVATHHDHHTDAKRDSSNGELVKRQVACCQHANVQLATPVGAEAHSP